VLVKDAPDRQTVEDVAERLVESLAKPFSINGSEVSGRASVGVAFTADGLGPAALLRQADLALYAAKAEGKGRWCRHEPALWAQTLERLSLRSALEQALPRGELFLEYQPILHLTDESTVGFEALLRWNHPTRHRLLPSQFIGVAEESHAMVPIGNWVLGQAVAAASGWSVRDAPAPYVSVNVSTRQFHAEGFAEEVGHLLDRSAVPPDRLMLEITESHLLRDDQRMWQELGEIRSTGVRVAVDDFGTGYSALTTLRTLPLDVLKLDHAFTSAITSSPQQADLVAALVRLAQAMRLDVVAEGIEHRAELDLLRRVECRYGQGYLFSGPLAGTQTVQWLAQHGASTG
jgi:EAL domain-containing protein (putative c-di-GMP-specific phosphodiesterase class I)